MPDILKNQVYQKPALTGHDMETHYCQNSAGFAEIPFRAESMYLFSFYQF